MRKYISYEEDISTSDDESGQGAESSSDDDSSHCYSHPRHRRSTVSHSPFKRQVKSSPPNKRRAPQSVKQGPKTKRLRPQTAPDEVEMGDVVVSDYKPQMVPGEFEEGDVVVSDYSCKLVSWQSLPYHILADIFLYASQPLCTVDFEVTPSVHWLLETARICKSFTEPALAALYYSPPLTPPTRARKLIECLESQSGGSAFKYANKVKYLDIEAEGTLGRKYKGQDPIDLGVLLQFTPQLRGLRIQSSLEVIFRLHSHKSHKTTYQQSMFKGLQDHEIALKEWIWCSEMAGQRYVGPKLESIHCSRAFQTLQSLTFIRYDEKHFAEEELAVAIKSLPRLKRLSFKGSRIVNEKLMPLLPDLLEQLELVNCPNLTSVSLSSFLVTGGQNILQLILDHNRALNLSFLTGFAAMCPNVQTLKMDLLYHSPHVTYIDLEPRFESLIDEDETPDWPSSLRSLDLYYLRKWDIDMAERFFSSLVDSASSLPNLRRINIRASVEESGWRDRVEFRDKWTSRIREVFLRASKPPNTHLRSVPVFKAHKQRFLNGTPPQQKFVHRISHVEIKEAAIKAAPCHASDSDGTAAPTTRRSNRLLTRLPRRFRESSPSGNSANDEDEAYVGPKAASIATRRARRRRKKNTNSSSSSDDSALNDSACEKTSSHPDERSQPKNNDIYIQGLCDLVNIFIDNLRPTEEQLHESDFLDEEMSGDEDWNGDAEVPGEGEYAW